MGGQLDYWTCWAAGKVKVASVSSRARSYFVPIKRDCDLGQMGGHNGVIKIETFPMVFPRLYDGAVFCNFFWK